MKVEEVEELAREVAIILDESIPFSPEHIATVIYRGFQQGLVTKQEALDALNCILQSCALDELLPEWFNKIFTIRQKIYES